MQRRPPQAVRATRMNPRRRIPSWGVYAFSVIVALLPAFGALEAGTLAIDFQNPQTLYAATQRGTFKSVDQGATWAPRNAGFAITTRSLYVNFLVMDPVNPRTLYAATQDQGLFKTTDGANTWVNMTTALPPLTALAVDPKTATTMYAAAGQGTLGNAGRVDHLGRIYKSTDGGLSWVPSSAGVADPMISAMVITPQAPHIIYAVTGLSGVLKSTDAGATWRPAGTGITSTRISALAIDAQSPTTLYVGTADRGVFKSVDGGASWSLIDRGLTNKVVSALVVDPLAASTIYAVTTTDLFRSIDAGSSWSRIGSVPLQALAIDPLTPSTMYVAQGGSFGGPGHVFKSQDAGVTWKRANAGLTDLVALALAVDPAHPEVLYASVLVDDERGVFKSSNGGTSWTRSDSGLDDGARILAPDPQYPATLYAVTTSGVFKSADGGASWKASSSGLPQHDAVSALAIHPKDSSTIYAGTLNTGLFKSVDAGRSWRPSAAGLDSRNVVAVIVDPHSAATVYAVLEDLPVGAIWVGGPRTRDRIGGVFKSVDGGTTWTGSDAGLPLFVSSIGVHPRTPNLLYASVHPAGVFRSGDGGVTWTANHSGLTAADVLGLTVNPQSTVYARTRSGVYKVTAGGSHWRQVNAGLPDQPTLDILELAVDPRDPGIVYAGTATHGMFKSTDGGEHWRPINAGLVASGIVAARPGPGSTQSPAKLISTLGDPGRAIIEGIGVGERTQIFRPMDCNTCRCDVQRISPTEYVEFECMCTLMACGTR
jgi:photosystem II stability/assembly factor-like uncharacterized protein